MNNRLGKTIATTVAFTLAGLTLASADGVSLPSAFTSAMSDGAALAAAAGTALVGLVVAIGAAKLTAKVIRRFFG